MKRFSRITILTLLMVVLLVPVQMVYAGAWTTLGVHVVQPGETLYCIGRGYGVDPWAIAEYNNIPITQADYLHPGLMLLIPDAYKAIPAGPTCTRQFDDAGNPITSPPTHQCRAVHFVRTGDTLTKISAMYGVNMWQIASYNGIYNLNYIRIGDSLCIP